MINGLLKCMYCKQEVKIKIELVDNSSLSRDIIENENIINVICNDCMKLINESPLGYC